MTADVDIKHWSHELQSVFHLVHHIPGRVRLKFNNRLIALFSQSKLNAFKQYCSKNGPLYDYELAPATGSLLIQYDPKMVAPGTIDQLFDQDAKKAQKALSTLVQLAQAYVQESEVQFEQVE